jgi:hypothetical protein
VLDSECRQGFGIAGADNGGQGSSIVFSLMRFPVLPTLPTGDTEH